MTYKEITNELNKFNKVKKDAKQVRTKASSLGLSKKKYSYDTKYFEKIDSQEKAYWLGFIYADGFVYSNKEHRTYELGIEIGTRDKELLNTFVRSIKGNMKISTRWKEESFYDGHKLKRRQISNVRVFSSKYVKDLENLNLVQNKTYRQEFPVVEKKYMNSFILGFMDGDGYISVSNDRAIRVGFVNGNKLFLNYLKDYINNNLSLSTSSVFQESEFKSRFSVHGNNALTLLNVLYDSSDLYLPRKKDIYLNYCIATVNEVPN